METSLPSRGGGVGVQVVLGLLVASIVHRRSFGCDSADLGTGFGQKQVAVDAERAERSGEPDDVAVSRFFRCRAGAEIPWVL